MRGAGPGFLVRRLGSIPVPASLCQVDATPTSHPAVNHNRDRLIWWHAAALVAICIPMFWIGLSWRSFASSEGHRVAPAWEMLDSGNLWRIRMFEQAYLRKPPGMPWAIAVASATLGRGEFAARSVSALSATLAALAAWWFASRWFGPRLGVWAGLGLVLMPQLWAPSRSAEIEALNNLGTLLACFAILDRVLACSPGPACQRDGTRTSLQPAIAGRIGRTGPPGTPEHPRAASWPITLAVILIGAAGMIIAVLAKGPASAPVVAAVLIAPALLRMWSRRANIAVIAMGAIAAAVLIPVGRRVIAATIGDPAVAQDAITQGAGEFLWAGGIRGAAHVLMLAPMALFVALPTSLAFMFPWGRDARAEAESAGDAAMRRLRAARLVGLSWLVALGIMCLVGVSNHRYAMPAACLLSPLVSYVAGGAWHAPPIFKEKRLRLARRLSLGRPLALPALLVSAAVLGNLAALRWQRGIDGREAGRTLAGALTTSSDLWADGLIEARPDVLLYARDAARARGIDIRPLWKKRQIRAAELPPPGAAIVLRTDDDSFERPPYDEAILRGDLVAIGHGTVGRYQFRVFRSVAR